MPAAPFGPERLMLLSLALVLSLGACQEPDAATAPSMSQALLPTDTTLTVARDGYVTSKHPNRNGGAKDSMDVAQPLRSLVAFDQAQIVAAVGAGTLTRATLRLTIGRVADNWGPSGRTVDVHRVTVPWTEAGETYNCAIDSDPSNTTKDCAGATEWAMAGGSNPPWVSPRTAQALVTTTTAGTLEFDVTADVAAFLAGTPNEGWLLKKTDEDKQGRIVFLTKEGGAAPQLVLTVSSQPTDTARPVVPTSRKISTVADTTLVASPPGDTVTIAYRNVFRVRFDDSTSGATIRRFLAEMQGEIISGNPNAGEYILRFPDPGTGYQAVDSLQRAIMSRVGVDYAVPSKRRSGAALYGRYPADGTGARRDDWIENRTDYTRPRIQIRAPLAWGCEMGAYGGQRVEVGVVDFFFNRTLADFAGMLAPQSEPDTSGRDMEASTVNPDHGSEVASIMVGAGDDATGIAGVLWNAELSLLALTVNGEQPVDLAEYFVETVLPLATSRGVRVLMMSMSLGTSDSADVRSIELAIAKFTAAGGLLVKATGNYDGYRTVEQLLQTTNHPNLGAEMAVAKLMQSNPQARSGLLFVAGTDDAGKFWSGSSFYPGMTEILAPAVKVGTLDFNGALHTVSKGNSLAAPFVGGVAGLLLAMDPTMTNAQVKDYLIRGSNVQRQNPGTGTWGPAPDPEAPDASVRQLDAYGSLQLLSRERSGVPLCGVEATFEPSPDGAGVAVLRRNQPELIPLPGRPGRGPLSIAQGGRLLAVSWFDEPANEDRTTEFRLESGQWREVRTLAPHFARLYLERDTVDWPSQFQPIIVRGPQWGTTGTALDLPATVGRPLVDWWVQLSPDARYAVFRSSDGEMGCGEAAVWLVALRTGSAQALEEPTCNNGSGLDRDAAWDDTGTRLITAIASTDSWYRAWTVSDLGATPDGPLVELAGAEVGTPPFTQHRFDPGDVTVQWLEWGASGTCAFAQRLARGSLPLVALRDAHGCTTLPVALAGRRSMLGLVGSARAIRSDTALWRGPR